MTKKVPSLPCPQCKTKVEMTENFPHRPFCSKRCKDLDFGDWANERNALNGDEDDQDIWSTEASD